MARPLFTAANNKPVTLVLTMISPTGPGVAVQSLHIYNYEKDLIPAMDPVPLAKGGFGEVWATSVTGLQAAVKKPLSSKTLNDMTIWATMKELELLTFLPQHANLVQLLGLACLVDKQQLGMGRCAELYSGLGHLYKPLHPELQLKRRQPACLSLIDCPAHR